MAAVTFDNHGRSGIGHASSSASGVPAKSGGAVDARKLGARERKQISKELSYILRHHGRSMGIPVQSNGFVVLSSLVPRLKSLRRIFGREQSCSADKLSGNVESSIFQALQQIVGECKKQRFTLRQCSRRITSSTIERASASASASASATKDDNSPVAADASADIREHSNTETQVEHLLRPIFSQWEIRANQGHTMDGIVVEDHKRVLDPETELPVCIHGTYSALADSIMKTGLNRMKRHHIHMAPGLPGELDPVTGKKIISGMRHDCDIIVRVNVTRAIHTHGLEFYRSSNGVVLCPGNSRGVIPPDCLSIESIERVPSTSGHHDSSR